jgi:hypothetical protein
LNKKISQLIEATGIDDGDIFVVVNGGETKKVTKANLLATINSLIAGKADTSSVAAALAGKADASFVSTALSTKLTASNNLSDLVSAAAARTSLGLGTMATQNAASYLPLTGGTLTGNLTVQDVSANTLYSTNGLALGVNRDKRKIQIDMKTKNNADLGGVDWTWYADADNAVVGNMQLTLYGYPRRTTDGNYYGYEPFLSYGFPTFNGTSTYTKQITNHVFTHFNQAVKIKSGNIGVQPLIVQGESGHTSNLTEWKNSSGNVIAVIDKSGIAAFGASTPYAGRHTFQPNGGSTAPIQLNDNTGANRWHWDVTSDGLDFVETNIAQNRLFLKAGGNIGMGINPTANLHIKAGTASNAPFKLTPGTNVSTPQTGAMEYDGTHLYFTIGTTRYQLDQQSGSGSSDLTVTTVTANSTLAKGLTIVNSASNTTQTLPTAVGKVGQLFVVRNINTGIVTVATTSSQTIDGESSRAVFDSDTFVSDGANWVLI